MTTNTKTNDWTKTPTGTIELIYWGHVREYESAKRAGYFTFAERAAKVAWELSDVLIARGHTETDIAEVYQRAVAEIDPNWRPGG